MSDKERNRQTPKEGEPKPVQETPPEDENGEATPEVEAPKPAEYQPIEPEDDKENPVEVEVPKTDEEVAEEGTKLSQAESQQTGGVVPFASAEPVKNKRVWALDAPHNTNDRTGPGPGWHRPDYVEHGG